MDYVEIIETLIGVFSGAFLAFVLGICANNINEHRKERHELKSLFLLMDINQAAIRTIGDELYEACSSGRIHDEICKIRDSDNAKYQIYEVKATGLRLVLEIHEHCAKIGLYEKLSQQIDFQDQVYKHLRELFELTNDELTMKIDDANNKMYINNLANRMIGKSDEWDRIKKELQQIRMF